MISSPAKAEAEMEVVEVVDVDVVDDAEEPKLIKHKRAKGSRGSTSSRPKTRRFIKLVEVDQSPTTASASSVFASEAAECKYYESTRSHSSVN